MHPIHAWLRGSALACGLLLWACMARPQGSTAEPRAPIVLGTTAAFSGPFAEYGQEYRKGADACLAPINAAGGVHGRQVHIRYLDDGYEPERTVRNAQALTDQGAVALLNLVGTGNLLALAPYLEQWRMPVIGISSGAVQLRRNEPGHSWIYHTKASYADEFRGFGRVLPTLGLDKMVLVYQDNAFGRAGLDSARAELERAGQPLPTVQLRTGADAVAQAAEAAHRLEPLVVVLIAAGAAAPEFIARYQQVAGPRARIAVLSVVGGQALSSGLGERVAGIMTSLVYPSPWSRARQVARSYLSALTAAGAAPSLLSFEGCLNLRLTVEALRQAGPKPSAASVRQVLQRGLSLDEGDFLLRLAPGSQVASRYTGLGIYRSNGIVLE